MSIINYYDKIKGNFIKNEVYKRVKDYSKNKSDLNTHFEVGRILVEDQGGDKRAKYGNRLIKEYSLRLTKELGKKYDSSNLRYMRLFYLKFKNCDALRHNLSWTHYRVLLPLMSMEEINYYIHITEVYNLSYRVLFKRIKSREYERIGYKEEFKEPKVNTLIKNPIIINTKKKISDDVSEYALYEFILEDMDNFLKELGEGFSYIGHEVGIKVGENSHYIDYLLFNYKYNCFVVVEIKVVKLKSEFIGQIQTYMNYVDKNMKSSFNDKTVGVIICKRDDKYVMEYCSDDRIFSTTYELINK
ncbi:MAG: DUF1016 family protein [Bacilli bacterium]|nr:DUF1016 family protein [Bacilli bacterium]